MASVQIISGNKWLQPLVDREKDTRLWQIPQRVIKESSISNRSTRDIRVEFVHKEDLVIEQQFTITSDCKIRFPKLLQELSAELRSIDRDEMILFEVITHQVVAADQIDFPSSVTRMMDVRIVQAKFRKLLVNLWKGCSVTNCLSVGLLRASHIKPWSNSSSHERLDQNNGLLLTPNIDALFDRGHVTFSPQGQLIIANNSKQEALDFGVHPGMSLRLNGEAMQKYMNYHRQYVFRK